MERRTQSRGDCVYCGREMTRGGLARHLPTCARRLEAQAEANKTQQRKQALYHLQVQDAYAGAFWLHLEMRGEATLKDLDHYLREIWLECCGHLSAFEISDVRYTQLLDEGMAWDEERGMNVKVDTLFTPGLEIPYEYDFGTTTDLIIKVVAQREDRPTTEHPIVLMARNKFEPPSCMECDKPATQLCNECMYDREDGRCESCATSTLRSTSTTSPSCRWSTHRARVNAATSGRPSRRIDVSWLPATCGVTRRRAQPTPPDRGTDRATRWKAPTNGGPGSTGIASPGGAGIS
ncbi:MAG: hypothetical protein IPM84_16825 [Anaerolineae bacterium]|nr:hypothetical protein [Anaerolineae bacterium]